MSIHVLSETVAAQIAAGEVIERPASVVKELIENALDAGASQIHVEIVEGGRRLIRVSDDGHGITMAEADLAFARHATSKINRIEDLNHLNTLGFRGEALHSIAAISRVTLVTRSTGEASGTRLHAAGGEIQERRRVGSPAGTVVTVEDLFYNTPARLKFLKNDVTERRHITSLVTQYAMAYPSVVFSLLQDGREAFRTYGTGVLADVLVKTLGADVFRDMLEVQPQPPSRPDLPPVEVTGFTSTPDQNRSNRGHITLFVNGRIIRDSSLTYAVSQAYHTLMPRDRFPVAVLMIAVPPDEVDVNVHPTKAEVRFRSPDVVFSAVQKAVRTAIIQQAPAPIVSRDTLSESSRWQSYGGATRRPSTLGSRYQQQELELELEGAGEYGQRLHPESSMPSSDLAGYGSEAMTAIPQGMGRPSQPRTLPMLRVLGQAGAAYIVTEGPAGLYLIDQHAAHERILFEQYLSEQAAQAVASQQMLSAVTVELPLAAISLLEEHAEDMSRLGFELEPFGGQTMRIRALPAMLAKIDPSEALQIILGDLETGSKPGQQTLEQQIALRVCKAAAVKAGQILSITEMQDIVRQLERCQAPLTCPHGRPTLIHISAEQLAREFGRT